MTRHDHESWRIVCDEEGCERKRFFTGTAEECAAQFERAMEQGWGHVVPPNDPEKHYCPDHHAKRMRGAGDLGTSIALEEK